MPGHLSPHEQIASPRLRARLRCGCSLKMSFSRARQKIGPGFSPPFPQGSDVTALRGEETVPHVHPHAACTRPHHIPAAGSRLDPTALRSAACQNTHVSNTTACQWKRLSPIISIIANEKGRYNDFSAAHSGFLSAQNALILRCGKYVFFRGGRRRWFGAARAGLTLAR